MVEKDYHLYGTKILNLKTQEIGLLICTWKNKFADAEIDFATCVNRQGKKYNIDRALVFLQVVVTLLFAVQCESRQ